MNSRLTFLLKVLIISCLLYLVEDLVVFGYNGLLSQLYRIFWPLSRPEFFSGYNSALRTIPYLALLLATPGIHWKHRMTWLACGIMVFMVTDMVSTAIWGGPPSRAHLVATSRAHYTFSLVWDTLGHWLLPLFLWIMAAHRQLRESMQVTDAKPLPGNVMKDNYV